MMSTMWFARPVVWGLVLGCSCAFAAGQNASSGEQEHRARFTELNVSYMNAAGHVTLGGTFTRPAQGGPFPAILLIPGSGPEDRDETVANHKPLAVLARYLTHRGMAVLRVDRRGVGTSTGDFANATTQDFASDAEAGMRYLMGRPDVDPKHVGLLGHGEGAIIAAMVADQVPQVSFVVLLAAPAIPGEQVLLTQRARAERAAHVPEAQIALDQQTAKILYGLAREGKKQRDLERALAKQERLQGELADLWANQLPSLASPWLRFFLNYNPGPALEHIKCPVLALEGEKDMDVSPDENVPALKAAFARGGNPNTTVEVLPGLNYFFQTAETGLPMEYPALEETISRVALERIGAWLGDHIAD